MTVLVITQIAGHVLFARYVCEGKVEGEMIWPPRGGKGFGYDPMFQQLGSSKTFAEIDPAAKHAVSHRADAFAKFLADISIGPIARGFAPIVISTFINAVRMMPFCPRL